MKVERLRQTGVRVLPSLFTLGNLALGFFALLAAADGEFARASGYILLGMVMDALDGRVARLVHAESAFGVEFDSLADYQAFCVAPAYLTYELLLKDIPLWGGGVAFLYALCGGLRLARFNVGAQAGGGSSGWFVGLPTPAAAGMVASFVLLYDMLESGRSGRTIGPLMHGLPYVYAAFPVLVAGMALLMVSNVPYRAFKQPFRPGSLQALLTMVVGAFFVFAYPQNALFLFFLAYLLSGLVGLALRRPADPPAP